jgi:hypothetical protein
VHQHVLAHFCGIWFTAPIVLASVLGIGLGLSCNAGAARIIFGSRPFTGNRFYVFISTFIAIFISRSLCFEPEVSNTGKKKGRVEQGAKAKSVVSL